jgi:hypothetical protein
MGDLGGEGCLLPPAFAKALLPWFLIYLIAVFKKKLLTFL